MIPSPLYPLGQRPHLKCPLAVGSQGTPGKQEESVHVLPSSTPTGSETSSRSWPPAPEAVVGLLTGLEEVFLSISDGVCLLDRGVSAMTEGSLDF